MPGLQELQYRFMDYLLDESTAMVDDIESTPMLSAKGRLDIYAAAYRLRLKEAITTDYDKLASYLGDDRFDQLMESYIDKYPSHTTNLRYFSVNLPELIRDDTDYEHIAEVYELACIDRAFADSFDAKDLQFSTMDDLAALPEQAWGTLTFKFQKSVQILWLEHNSFPIWKALAEEETPPKAEKSHATAWILWRRSDLISHYRMLAPEEIAILALAMQGETFAVMCEKLLDFFSEEETPMKAISFLQSWISEEMLAGFEY
ncbi:MAG: putative DNA-binding domain-containing protein [Methylophaga sp.]|nr:putative DNA-binding domain-containing protein [Methylophaga sp.]